MLTIFFYLFQYFLNVNFFSDTLTFILSDTISWNTVMAKVKKIGEKLSNIVKEQIGVENE